MAAKKTTEESAPPEPDMSPGGPKVLGSALAPVHVDSTTARDVRDPFPGGFATVKTDVEDHAGKYGVVESVLSVDSNTGYPDDVLFVTRDDNSERLVVKYDDLERSEAGHR